VATITRLTDLGIAPYMLASSLQLVVAQRLVRRVCAHCAEPYEPDRELLRLLQIDPADPGLRRGRGCGACRKSGSVGRVGVFEVLSITPELAKLIEAKAPESALRAQARADGARALAEHAAERVRGGLVTIEEVLRVVDVSAPIHCPGCDRPVEYTFSVCPHCATVLRRNCGGCGVRLEKEWQTCPYCGMGAARVGAGRAHSAPQLAKEAVAMPAAQAAAQSRQYRVLIVDDDPDIRFLTATVLKKSALPLSTITAPDGQTALELVHAEPPDVILLDVMMPGMDGYEVCRQLRANVRTAFIPILMVTARDDAASRVNGFLVGTDDYIGKPFDNTELQARVRRLLERTYGVVLPQLTPAVSELKASPVWSTKAEMSPLPS